MSVFIERKIFCVIMVLVMVSSFVCNINAATVSPIPTMSTKVTSTEIIYGDNNGDGHVDSADYTILRRYLLGIIDVMPNSNWSIVADVNGDERVDSADYTLLRSYLLRKINTFPCEVVKPTATNTPTRMPISEYYMDTVNACDITSTSATLGGSVTQKGMGCVINIVYWEKSNPDNQILAGSKSFEDAWDSNQYSVTVTGLKPNTEYEFGATGYLGNTDKIKASFGGHEGYVKSFKTLEVFLSPTLAPTFMPTGVSSYVKVNNIGTVLYNSLVNVEASVSNDLSDIKNVEFFYRGCDYNGIENTSSSIIEADDTEPYGCNWKATGLTSAHWGWVNIYAKANTNDGNSYLSGPTFVTVYMPTPTPTKPRTTTSPTIAPTVKEVH